ncbi:MAG: hypothetical protein QXQ18_01110 [Candidatus Aenigmatarchaeota archaeon]
MAEELIKRFLKRLKKRMPWINTERIEKDLIPLRPEEHLQPKLAKKKKFKIK